LAEPDASPASWHTQRHDHGTDCARSTAFAVIPTNSRQQRGGTFPGHILVLDQRTVRRDRAHRVFFSARLGFFVESLCRRIT
jgi:hypothetical protein